MKQTILYILFLLLAKLALGQKDNTNEKAYKLFVGVNYLNPILEGIYDVKHLPIKENPFVNNLGVQLAYNYRPKQRITFYYNHFQRDYNAKASPINYFDLTNVAGWQIKTGGQWLVPLEQYHWINLCFGTNAGFSTNKIRYSTALFEPTLGTYKHLDFNENRTLFSLEAQAGFAFVMREKIEFSLLTTIGYAKRSKTNNEILYSYPMYGVSIGSMYVSVQSILGFRF